ncbi:importin subunit beta-3 isoform X3 [Medicago truncatula]|uniref:importin subunit beta-3 isoform X3 n=1 Tax=Medicago truncatula TaxID=3880 RepID=UPI0019689261|nr:importin subunit beta-3 isoform X3 [Medicago truncatula]
MKLKFTFPSKNRHRTSTSASVTSPPPPPPPPPLESSLRNPFEPDINPPPRNYLEEIVNKRRRIEENQDESLLHGFELQQHVATILQSNDLSSLQEVIDEYANSKDESLFTIFKSFAHHYPNAFALKLAKLLEFQPPIQTRIETVNHLLQVLPEGINGPFNSIILLELKNPLLHSLKAESEEILFLSLCEAIGLLADRFYRCSLGGWVELLEYVLACFSSEVQSENKKGLLLLTVIPVDVANERAFWLNQGNFDLVFGSILEWTYRDKELKGLAYNASISLMLLSQELKRTDVCDFLLPNLLSIIDEHGEEEVLVDRVKRLGDLVTLDDDGKIFAGVHREVFWCMIRAVEIEAASEEVMCEAIVVIKEFDTVDVETMESVIGNLSLEEVKRVFAVAMKMLSCVIDDPLWYDVDDKNCTEAGFSDAFHRGQFLFNFLSLDGDEYVFVPTAIGMITTKYASNVDWRLRHAAMLAIASIAEKNLNEMDMMLYFNEVAILVLKSLDEPNHRVLWATMHAVKCLSECKELLMRSQYHKKFLEKLVPVIRCNSCARVQVEAIDTLKSFAVSMQEIFRQNHYDTTMEALKAILSNKYSLPKLLLCAKCQECMVYLVRKVGPDDFKEQEAVQVVESLISLDGKLSNTEYLTKCIILKALDQICQCPKVSVDKFIDKIMPMLIACAQPLLDLTGEETNDDSLSNEDKRLVETMRARACNTLSHCAVRSSINFSPHIAKVTPMFIRLLGCSSSEIRKASILGLPKLLLSAILGDKSNDTKRDTTFIIVQALTQVLKTETDRDLSTLVLRLLGRCIETSSTFFTDQLIKIVTDEINDTIRRIIKFEIEKAQESGRRIIIEKAQEVGTSEDVFRSLSVQETIEEVVNLTATAIHTFEDQLMVPVNDLMSNVSVFLHATRAFGICAMYGGNQFKFYASAGISYLSKVISKGLSTSELYDTAVAALGKICEFHRDNTGSMVVKKWLYFLPLKHDLYMHMGCFLN